MIEFGPYGRQVGDMEDDEWMKNWLIVKDLYINFYMCDTMTHTAIKIDYFGPCTPEVMCGTPLF